MRKWKDPEPDPKPNPHPDPYMWLTDSDADPGGPKIYRSVVLKMREKLMRGMPMRVAQAAWSLLLSREITWQVTPSSPPCLQRESKFRQSKMEVAKLLAHLLATQSLWVCIETSYKKSTDGRHCKRVANTILPTKIKSGKESGSGYGIQRRTRSRSFTWTFKYFPSMENKQFGRIPSMW